jgi:hypothetical protein
MTMDQWIYRISYFMPGDDCLYDEDVPESQYQHWLQQAKRRHWQIVDTGLIEPDKGDE